MKVSEFIPSNLIISFLSRDWNSKPEKFDENTDKYTKLPKIADLTRSLGGVIEGDRWSIKHEPGLTASKVDENGKLSQRMNVPCHLAQELYSDGFTICFGDTPKIWSDLEELRDDALMLGDLPSEVIITCYLSPTNSTGVLHFDSQHNFFLQVEGTKIWTVSLEPTTNNPISNFQ